MRPETRARILATAERLRYRPNALARGLKTATTTTFGMLVPSLRNPVYASIVRGAVAEAWRRGYVVLLAEDDGTVTEQAWERLVEEGRIDGILRRERRARDGRSSQLVEESHVPYVFVNRRAAGQRPQRLDARGGRGAHRRRAPDRARPHAARADRRAARARHGPAPRRRVRRRVVLAAGLERPAIVEAPFQESSAPRGDGAAHGARARRRPASSSRT